MSTLSAPSSPLSNAIEHLKNGKMIILIDDENRENEGDLILPAEFVTADAINFMAKYGRGLICLALTSQRIKELNLPMMSAQNQSRTQTAFTVSIEAREGVTTGISASDRATTVRVASDPSKSAMDIVSPGHIFPLRAVAGGVLIRGGHTEGSVDLMKIAGLRPAAVICEIMNEDGTMARLSDLQNFSKTHSIPIVTIREIIEERMQKESLIEQTITIPFQSHYGNFELSVFESSLDHSEHLALVKYDKDKTLSDPCLVRVHTESVTGDLLHSLTNPSHKFLVESLQIIEENGSGVLVYIRKSGLPQKTLKEEVQNFNKKSAYSGYDLKHYGIGAQILRHLGVTKMKLLTNRTQKVTGLEGYGLEVSELVPFSKFKKNYNSKQTTTESSL